MTALRFCAAPGCHRRVTGFADLCAGHHAMLPGAQARMIRQMRIEQFHARGTDAEAYLGEQADGYLRSAVRSLPGARHG